jgi:putative tryptophan/tyrosine transport system substrate-binding protein
MKRREFVTLIGGAAVWPIAARAQRSGAMRHIAVVGALAPDDVETVKRSAAFEQALAALGWTKGGTIAIDYHWIANDSALAQKTAVEVVALAPDVLLASSNIVIEQLSKATGTIPIVMVQVVDPVGSGYVESMARPGGNITGFTQFEYSLAGKWLDLLLEIAPGTTRVAVLRDPTRGAGIGQFAVIQAMAPARGVEPIPINTFDVADMERRITAFASVPNGGMIATAPPAALLSLPQPTRTNYRRLIPTATTPLTAVSFPMVPTRSTSTDVQPAISIGSSKGRSRLTYQCRGRPNMN